MVTYIQDAYEQMAMLRKALLPSATPNTSGHGWMTVVLAGVAGQHLKPSQVALQWGPSRKESCNTVYVYATVRSSRVVRWESCQIWRVRVGYQFRRTRKPLVAIIFRHTAANIGQCINYGCSKI